MKRIDGALTRGTVPAGEPTVGKLRVLIAEKEVLPAVCLKVLLEGFGHRVVGVARDGKDAAEAAWMLEPDLIIMNSRLPVTAYLSDGIEAARMILRQGAVPIILLGPGLSVDLARRARGSGLMAHLVEPVDGKQLRSAIKRAVARFAELQALREEANDLRGALEVRTLVDRAKRVLVKELKISEVEAFRRIQHHRQSMNKSFRAIASTIVKADDLLVRSVDFARCLLGIHYAIHPGLG